MDCVTDLLLRLERDHRQLAKATKLAGFGGDELGVNVKDPEALIKDLDEARQAIFSMAAVLRQLSNDDLYNRNASRWYKSGRMQEDIQALAGQALLKAVDKSAKS